MGDAAPTPAPHQVPEAEADARIEGIVRRALAELRAIDPGCDCTVLHGARVLLALGLDERVILARDAFAAVDLVRYLEHVQSCRRDAFELDRVTVDGPTDIRAAKGGPLVRVTVRVGGQWVEVAKALDALNVDEAGGAWPPEGITGPGAWSTRDGVTWTRHAEGVVAMGPGTLAGYLITTPAEALRAMFEASNGGVSA